VCTHSPQGQPHSGLHPKQRGQQVEREDSNPLLRSSETPLGALHPALEPLAQESHGPVGVGPEEATKIIRGLEHLCCEERLRVGAVQPAEEKALERLYNSLPVPEVGLQESWRGTFYKGM